MPMLNLPEADAETMAGKAAIIDRAEALALFQPVTYTGKHRAASAWQVGDDTPYESVCSSPACHTICGNSF